MQINNRLIGKQVNSPAVCEWTPQAGWLSRTPQAGWLSRTPQAGWLARTPQAGWLARTPQAGWLARTPQAGWLARTMILVMNHSVGGSRRQMSVDGTVSNSPVKCLYL